MKINVTNILQRFTIILVVLLLLFQPITVSAQVTITNPLLFVNDISAGLRAKSEKVQDQTKALLLSAGLGALMEGVSFFTRKLAYDTARWVAYGGKGQGTLAFQEGFGPYLENVAKDTVGEAIYQLGQPFGLNLCQIPDLGFVNFLNLGILGMYNDGGPQSNCSWTELRNNWSIETLEARYSYLSDPELDQLLLYTYNDSLTLAQSDFGVALSSLRFVDRELTKKETQAQLDREEGDGFKPVVDFISGDVRTPAQVVKKEIANVTAAEQKQTLTQQVAGAYGAGTLAALKQAGSVFLNTLTSELLTRVMTKGLLPPRSGSPDGTDPTDPFGGGFVNNKQQAERAFSFLLTATPNKSLNAYEDELITQFATCPQYPGVYNCVMDNGFVRAIERAKGGSPLTMQEAIDAGFLGGDKPLIPPEALLNSQRDCYEVGYCYSNIQKMRKARIVPLGFEIAAKSGNPDNPDEVTLQKVIDGFEDCNTNNQRDAAHPYCHLIDPNWLIITPPLLCNALVYGDIPVSDVSAERQEECADLASCVLFGENGDCLSYGYCTAESNSWNFPGQSCPAEYNTCRTYVQQSDGSVDSYLSRTVDYDQCTADTVGCRAYSTVNLGDTWLRTGVANIDYKQYGNNGVIYYTAAIDTPEFMCNASDAGCTQFFVAALRDGVYAATDEQQYLKAAPEYLTCYDSDALTEGIENGISWPTTVAEAERAYASTDACTAYAPACIASEVGCHDFTPVDGGIAIPGKIGANSCVDQCVGYDTFRQKEVVFEAEQDGLNFIPAMGTACMAEYEGCSEFTNLSNEGLEYYTRLRYCEIPNGNNEKEYYSWEGSATDGFVLRRHTLAQFESGSDDVSYYRARLIAGGLSPSQADEMVAVGAPKYAAQTTEELVALYEQCNRAAYNLRLEDEFHPEAAVMNCRALYDENENVYYRIVEETVSVSNQCIGLRKTVANLSEDAYLTSTGTCTERGGTFAEDGTTCLVCRGGGVYDNGACLYSNIPGEGTSCPASQNECRAYIGTRGSNVQRIDIGRFESGDDTEGWSSGQVVEEAITVGFHSLEVASTETVLTLSNSTFNGALTNAAYEISFWARGVPGQSLRVVLSQDGMTAPLTFGTADITNTWREYRIGPIAANTINPDLAATITIVRGANSAYYIDNVSLNRTMSYEYRIKNSWRTTEIIDGARVIVDVPLACDADPLDAFAGEALGCRAYVDESGDRANATGFEQLCREHAIGCTPFIDTQNNTETTEVWNNLRCGVGNPDADFNTTVKSYVSRTRECTLLSDAFEENPSCIIPQGEDHCYISRVVWPFGFSTGATEYTSYFNEFVDRSTVVTPADTVSTTPIFLADQPTFRCSAGAAGCEAVAVESQIAPEMVDASFEHNEQYIKNLPDRYADVLCTESGVGCDEWQSENVISYFKDPEVTGNTLCEYRDNVTINGARRSGWFRMDGGSVTPCYPGYLDLNGRYGIWSNETISNYQGYVGVCEEEYHLCTEFIDTGDTSQSGSLGTPYYALYTEDLISGTSDCEGVSLKEGCVLFDKTDEPNKRYNTVATYRDSENKDGDAFGFVDPNTSGTRDANIILKVERTRECREWLACRRSFAQKDDNGNVFEVCYDYGLCTESIPGGGCASFVDNYNVGTCSTNPSQSCVENSDCQTVNPSTGTVVQGVCNYRPSKLTESVYSGRDTSWYGIDYSGYSILDTYSYNNFISIVLNPEDAEDTSEYLAYQIPESVFTNEAYADQSCSVVGTNETKENWTVCGLGGEGRCFYGKCIAPVSGQFPTELNQTRSTEEATALAQQALISGSCKVHPEADAPFPSSVVLTPEATRSSGGPRIYNSTIDEYRYDFLNAEKRSAFRNVNVLQRLFDETVGMNKENSCLYRKVRYQNQLIDYITIHPDAAEWNGICSAAADNAGAPCNTDSHCTGDSDAAICEGVEQRETYIGTEGYCLQRDVSRPIHGGADYACIMWLPIETSVSRIDVYNNEPNAGYNPVPGVDIVDQGGELYCLASTDYGSGAVPANHYNIAPPSGRTLEEAIAIGGTELSVGSPQGPIYYYRDESSDDVRARVLEYFEDVANNSGYSSGEELCACQVERVGEENQSAGLPGVNGFYLPPEEYYATSAFYDACTDWEDDGYPAGECPVIFQTDDIAESDPLGDFLTEAVLVAYDASFAIGSSCVNNFFNLRGDPLTSCDDVSGIKAKDAKWKRKELNRSCSNASYNDFDRGVYHDLVCGIDNYDLADNVPNDTTNRTDLYDVIQTWAWDQLSDNDNKNAYVIRLEYAREADDNDTIRWNDDYGVTTGDDSFALLPEMSRDNGNNNKTMMHPPRQWRTQSVSPPYIDETDDEAVSFSTVANTADTVSELTGVLYTSPLQHRLTENILSDVYFVPLRFPGGIGGAVPRLMSKDFYLDFDALREDEDGYIERGGVAMAWGAESYKGRDNNERNRNNDVEFPRSTYPDAAGKVINYVLTRSGTASCNGLYSFCEYNESAAGADDSRNEIHKRYVVYFESEESEDPFTAIPTSRSEDPFGEKACDTSGTEDIHHRRSWYAIGMDFNANGEFLGYITRTCQTGSRSMGQFHSDAGMQLAVIARVYDQCTEFVSVYDSSALGTTASTNKAWTNRVWSGTNAGPIMSNIESETVNRPYGSIIHGSDWLETDGRAGYGFYDDSLGAPFGCRVGSLNIGLVSPFSNALQCAALPSPPPASAGSRFTTDVDAPAAALGQRFAKFYATASDVISESVTQSTVDRTFTDRGQGIPPQIYGVHPIGCNAASAFASPSDAAVAPCIAAAKDTITINDKNGRIDIDYDGDGVTDEDKNRDGNWDGLIGRGSYFAVMRFFAFADHNRMPIKSVKIDWNDGITQPFIKTGMYKNKKPICGANVAECEDAAGEGTQLTCTDGAIDTCTMVSSNWSCGANEVNFGNQDRACEEGFFEHSYTYTCTERMAEFDAEIGRAVTDFNPDIQRELRALGLEDGDRVCAFKPRVQVTDNWGWCNGTDGGRDQGYYNDMTREGRSDECNVLTEGPWTSFSEEIIVIPR